MILDAACPDRFPPPARTTGAMHQAANGADSKEGGGLGARLARSVSRGASSEIPDVAMAEAVLAREILRSKESAENPTPVTPLSGCLSP